MKATVFVAAKPGEERRYSSTVGWSPEAAESLRAQGFRIFAIDYAIHDDFDTSDQHISGRVNRRVG